jgi:hypothetical protein
MKKTTQRFPCCLGTVGLCQVYDSCRISLSHATAQQHQSAERDSQSAVAGGVAATGIGRTISTGAAIGLNG